MNLICPRCRKPKEDDRLVLCPDCKVGFEEPQALAIMLSSEDKNTIAKNILKVPRFWMYFIAAFLLQGFTIFKIVDGYLNKQLKAYEANAKAKLDRTTGELEVKVRDEIAVRFNEPKIQSLMESVVVEKSNQRIDETADKLIEAKIAEKLLPRLGELEQRANSINESVYLIDLISRARTDDRAALDAILKISETPDSIHRTKALEFLRAFQSELAQMNMVRFNMEWARIGIKPEEASIQQLESIYSVASRIHKPDVLWAIWESRIIATHDKVAFLLNTAQSTDSVKVLQTCCNLLAKEADLKFNALGWRKYTEWWNENKHKY